MKSHIVVPISFKEGGKRALQQANHLAEKDGLDIVVAHVVSEKSKIDEARKQMNAFLDNIEFSELVTVTPLIHVGQPVKEIVALNAEVDPLFTILPFSKEEKNWKKMGDVTARLVKEAKRPVVSLKMDQDMSEVNSIVLPVDLTKETRQKTAYALRFAKIFGAEIKLVMVHEEETKRDKVTLKVYENQIVDRLKKSDVKFSVNHVNGKDIAVSLNEFVSENGGDLMMIMNKEEGAFARMFVGSVANEILQKATIPVMSIAPRNVGVYSWGT